MQGKAALAQELESLLDRRNHDKAAEAFAKAERDYSR